MLLKIFLQCMSTNLTFLIPQMRRQSRCCQVSTFAPLASWLTRTMLSFRDPLHYACWRLVNDVSLSYLMFITLEKTLFQVWKIFLFPGSRKVSLVLVAFGYSCYVFTPRYACLFWILVVITNSLDKKTVCVQGNANAYLLIFWGSHFLEGVFLIYI